MAKQAEKAPETQTYILRPNHEHNGFKNGERHTFVGGDEVELTQRQYEAFKDKFDSKKELQARARVARGGEVSREEALAALGITEEAYAKIAPVEPTIKKPDGDEPKGEPIAVEPAPKETKDAGAGKTASDAAKK